VKVFGIHPHTSHRLVTDPIRVSKLLSSLAAMMESKNSYLSNPRCQCDFVVATTQASINSGLLEYLDEQT
jgi:hypothetical protein